MDFLNYVDVAIGIALVMVLLSPAVTAVTQAWMWVRQRRAEFLLQMLQRLIVQLGAGPPDLAHRLAVAVINHPLVARPPLPGVVSLLPWLKKRDAEVVEREELIRILLELAAGQGASTDLTAGDRGILVTLLAANSIANPSQTLDEIRTESQRLEASEPEVAAHVRHAKAIVTKASSTFVGKINDWFDVAVTRATQQYAAEAKSVTVVAALLVALALQFDTLNLLRRLSMTGELRAALLEEAKREQERLEKNGISGATPTDNTSPNVSNTGEEALARAKRDEIERNLATLRNPGLSILPEHFLWQAVPRARLIRNPTWASPYPTNLALLTGGSTYLISVSWRRDPLIDIAAAIEASDAPVTTTIAAFGHDVVLRSHKPVTLQLSGAKDARLESLIDVAQAVLDTNSTWPDNFDYLERPMRLMVDSKPFELHFTSSKADLFSKLAQQIATHAEAGVSVVCYDSARKPLKSCADPKRCTLTITAADPHVDSIRLLWNPNDPFSNVLNDTVRVGRAWRADMTSLRSAIAGGFKINVHYISPLGANPRPAVSIDVPSKGNAGQLDDVGLADTLSTVVNQQRELPELRASIYADDHLIITGQRQGPLELRYVAVRPDTNILTTHPERELAIWALLNPQVAAGILLSWILLSLGAPFWYDALKNLLRLRPTAAIAEEKHRAERNTDSRPAK